MPALLSGFPQSDLRRACSSTEPDAYLLLNLRGNRWSSSPAVARKQARGPARAEVLGPAIR
jgi:hypothetical protein